MGLVSQLSLECSAEMCSYSMNFYTSSRVNNKSKAFEANRRAVLAMRNIGVGHQGLVKFCGAMNMLAPMNANSYTDHVTAIHGAAELVAKASMKSAAEETKQFYEPEEDGVYDVGISADGSWRRRGYSSSYGVVTGMSLVTGKVLDIEVMSKECRECITWSSKKGSEEFEHWWEGHQHNCHANFEGSSGAMDAAGCVRIFERSVEQHSLRYVEFLGDGDSKAYNEITESLVYGEKPVTKLECVGHVQKRMGSRLRSLKKRLGKTHLSDGKGIGGKGRLTDKVIDNLQVYYGKAIRNNTHSIEDMENAVLAIFHHTRSTDENPDHNLCPEGETSWCGYQRDLAKNTNEYSHSHPLPEAVSDSILPVFTDLSKSRLLSSCLHGGTQNQNEAFNALIWQRATKETHSSLPTVELATFLAVGIFNNGAKAILDILENLGIKPGCQTKKCLKKIDYDRLRHSTRKSSDKQKNKRKKIRQRKKGYIDNLSEKEGTKYEAGAF
jgi:hypothetical protein